MPGAWVIGSPKSVTASSRRRAEKAATLFDSATDMHLFIASSWLPDLELLKCPTALFPGGD
jgi:hypothetical protein